MLNFVIKLIDIFVHSIPVSNYLVTYAALLVSKVKLENIRKFHKTILEIVRSDIFQSIGLLECKISKRIN